MENEGFPLGRWDYSMIGEEDEAGAATESVTGVLWRPALLGHRFQMGQNQRKALFLLPSVTSFGLLQVRRLLLNHNLRNFHETHVGELKFDLKNNEMGNDCIVIDETGAFAAMALLGKMDQILAPKGLSMTIAPLGAVCAVLFATPSAPAARVLAISLI